MAQKREKDEPLELKVPADGPLSSLPSCPDKIPSRPDPARMDLSSAVSPDKKPLKRPRSEGHLRLDAEDPPTTKISSSSSSAVAGETAEEEPAPKKKAVNRCTGCGKRVGLTGFKCRCGDLFCSEHRYSDRHDCTYDYKAAGREAIARENPVVKAPKIFKV